MQSILLILTSIIMNSNSVMLRRHLSVLSSGSNHSVNPQDRFEYQMKILAGFYAVCTIIDWSMFFGGKRAIANGDVLCFKKTVLLVNSNLGGLYMLAFAGSVYVYAIFMWYTFYQVPKKFGMITNHNVSDLGGMTPAADTSIMLDEENLKTVIRELDYEKKFIRNQHSR